MAALPAGTAAPNFALPTTEGKQFSLAEARKHGPVVLAFFKVSCPVCQFALPYLQRMHEAYRNGSLTIVGVSQNTRKETLSFMRDYGITFPVLLDDARTYRVSNDYGLTNVPTVFLVGRDGQIQLSSVGWVRNEIEDVNSRLATATSVTEGKVIHPGEDVPDFRPG